jgi:hypothetical protein
MQVQMLQASQRQALRQSRASLDELRSNQQVPQDAQRLEPPQIQLRERAPPRPVSQPSPEQQAPRQQQASHPQLQALLRPASPPVSSPQWLSRPFRLLQLLRQPPSRESACAPVQRASGQSSSSASFFP